MPIDVLSLILSPGHRVILSLSRNRQHLTFLLVSLLSQLIFEFDYVLEILILNSFLFYGGLHLSKLDLHLTYLISNNMLLIIKPLKLGQLLVRLFNGFCDVLILLNSHVHCLILEGQGILVSLVAF